MANLSNLTIACTTNEKYIPYTERFFQSIRTNSPGCDIYVRFINCKTSSAQRLVDKYNIYNYAFETLDVSNKRVDLSKEGVPIHEFITAKFKKNISPVKGARWLASSEMSYCSNIRFNVINDLLKKGSSHILYSDVDTIITGNLAPLYNIIDDTDIAVRVDRDKQADNKSYPNRPVTEPDGLLYHMGLLGVKNTPVTRKAFKQIEDSVWNDMGDWDADHIEFCKVVEPLRVDNIIDIHELSRKFKDEGEDPKTGISDGFQPTSLVWSGAGDIKYTNEQYNLELRKYE